MVSIAPRREMPRYAAPNSASFMMQSDRLFKLAAGKDALILYGTCGARAVNELGRLDT